jgi:hypothetical protein
VYGIETVLPDAVPESGGVRTIHGTLLETLHEQPVVLNIKVYEPAPALGPRGNEETAPTQLV